MTTLSADQRTILRSRIARHVDGVLVAEYMQAKHNARNTAELTRTAPLLDVARQFSIAIPDKAQADFYRGKRTEGFGTREAMAQLEGWVRTAAPVDALANILPTGASTEVAGGGGLVDDIAAAEEIEASETELAREPADADADAEALALAQAAERDVKDILNTFANDMPAFGPKLRALAVRANKPAQIIEVAAPYDASRAEGYVAKRLRVATMKEAGIPAALMHASEKATTLPVYDYPNAPAIDADYVWPDHTAAWLSAMRRGRNLFAVGPAGTGKTEFAQQIAARYGREYIRISCDDQTEASTLVGMTIPDGQGGVRWQDGQLARAVRKPGAVILIDEPSVARAGALMVFQAVLDDARKLYVQETGEVIPVAPDVIFILADNTNGTGDRTGQYEATRIINRASLDRVSQTIVFAYLDADTEARLLAKRTGCTQVLAQELVKFANLTRAKANEGGIKNPIGFRRLRALAECMADGGGAAYAFASCVLHGATHDDGVRYRQIWEVDFNAKRAGVDA